MMRMISRLRVDQNRIGVRGQIRIGGYSVSYEMRNFDLDAMLSSIGRNRILL